MTVRECLENIGLNMVAEFLFFLIPIFIGFIFVRCTHRKKLLRFFGVQDSRRLVVYLSNLRIVVGGAVGVDGRKRSYQGRVASFFEMRVANRFRELFNYPIPSAREGPSVLSKLLLCDVRVDLLPSPLKHTDVEQSAPFITLGSSAYSAASGFVEIGLHSQARVMLGRESTGLRQGPRWAADSRVAPLSPTDEVPITSPAPVTGDLINRMSSIMKPGRLSTVDVEDAGRAPEQEDSQAGIEIEGVCARLVDPALGIIERLVDRRSDGKRFVFYTAGISEEATAGAAYYLASQWKELNRKYPRGEPFVVVLRFETGDHRRGSIVFERSSGGGGREGDL